LSAGGTGPTKRPKDSQTQKQHPLSVFCRPHVYWGCSQRAQTLNSELTPPVRPFADVSKASGSPHHGNLYVSMTPEKNGGSPYYNLNAAQMACVESPRWDQGPVTCSSERPGPSTAGLGQACSHDPTPKVGLAPSRVDQSPVSWVKSGLSSLSLTMYPFSISTDGHVPLKFHTTKYFIML